jgi:uncharacterized SAM-binding protein YcdF (DUF218 family)
VATASTAAGTLRARRITRLVVALVLALLITSRMFITAPAVDVPAKADVIQVLAGESEQRRLALAWDLAREGLSRTLLVSVPQRGGGNICHWRSPPPGVTEICFRPDPSTTQGEAEQLAERARQANWHSALVVVSQDQVTRARIRLRRCFHGSLRVVAAPVPSNGIAFVVAYEWAALVKAETLQRSC